MGNCFTQSQTKREAPRTAAQQVQNKNANATQVQPRQHEQTNIEEQRRRDIVPITQVKVQEKAQDKSQTDQNFQHTDNPHRNMFRITSTQRSSKIVFINPTDTNCYNCIKKESIAVDSFVSFKIKQTKTLRQHVYIGIATETMMTSPSHWNEMMVLGSRSGQVWENGGWLPKGNIVKDGDEVLVLVDTRAWIVYWKIGDSKECSSKILQKMRQKKLYLVIVMHDKNDTVELLY